MTNTRVQLTSRAEELRDRRVSIDGELKDVAAALWRDGLHNVRELSRLTGMARPTLYTALRERDIEPTNRGTTNRHPAKGDD